MKPLNLNIPRKYRAGLVVLIITVIAIPLLVFAAKQVQDIRNRAYESQSVPPPNQAVLYFESQKIDKYSREQVVKLMLDTHGRKIDGVQLIAFLKYGGGTPIVTPTNPLVYNLNQLKIVTKKAENDTGNKYFKATGAAVTANPQQPFSTSGPVELARVTLVAQVPNASTSIYFDKSSTKVIDHDSGKNIATYLPDLIINTNFPPTPTASSSATPTPTKITPPPPDFIILEDFNNDSIIDLEDYHILAVNFDPTLRQPGNIADINKDGYVDIDDYNLLVKVFGVGKKIIPPIDYLTPTPNPRFVPK